MRRRLQQGDGDHRRKLAAAGKWCEDNSAQFTCSSSRNLDVFVFVSTTKVSHLRELFLVFSSALSSLLATLPAESSRELHVLGHDRHTLRVQRAEVGILEKADHVCLAGLLQRNQGLALEPYLLVRVVVQSGNHFPDNALEGCFSDEQLGRGLQFADLLQRFLTWLCSVRFLDRDWCASWHLLYIGRAGSRLVLLAVGVCRLHVEGVAILLVYWHAHIH
mmetsp:Transcript_2770/g.6421  ORF Transcript_2770/g.6421 Transcript_2770/m.6421 type:complete len:219 (-) Transcript_2770:337-993(-)